MKPYTLLCALCLASMASAKSPTIVTPGLGDELDAYCQQQSQLGFSGTVLIAKEGKVLLRKGYGLADRKQAIANGPDTLFEIASLAKQFTAAAILALAEDGKLSTQDSIAKVLPNVGTNASQRVGRKECVRPFGLTMQSSGAHLVASSLFMRRRQSETKKIGFMFGRNCITTREIA